MKTKDEVSRKVLKWLGHVVGLSGERLTVKVYESAIEERREKDRPCER